MGAFSLNKTLFSPRLLPVSLLLASLVAQAAEPEQSEVIYDADKITSQLRADTMELTGNVSFVQGQNSIAAERAHRSASGKSERWSFQGSVRVRNVEAELRADVVNASVVNGQLSTARAEGSPAEFRQLSGAADSRGHGRANVIEYDVGAGVVKLTGGAEQVWFVYGKEKNEFRTDVLTYNMRTGTVSTGRTRGTIRLNGKAGAANDASPTVQGADETPTDTPGRPGDGA